jgi:hypothetical protein
MTKRIAWVASFTAAATVALLMWVADYDWFGTLRTAALSCAALAGLMLTQLSAVASSHRRSRWTAK